MRYAVLVLTTVCLHAQDAIEFVPAVVTQCAANGLGSGLVSWKSSSAGPLTVRLGDASGIALTGASPAVGTAQTGDWVIDGRVFVLVDAMAHELARTTARVKCNAAAPVLASGLASAAYFPLQVGNQWIYALNSRVSTSTYITKRISRAEIIGGTVWFVMEESVSGSSQLAESRFRSGDAGRIYQLTGQGEKLWLDPTSNPDPAAVYPIAARVSTAVTPAGVFQDGLTYRVIAGALSLQTGTFARGIGLVVTSNSLLTGSSGGFTDGLNLVHAKIDGHIVFAPVSNSLEISAEATNFDVSNRRTSNCAIPCYFAACGIAGADPAGTYKPCFRATVRLGQAAAIPQRVDLDLFDASNRSVYHSTLIGAPDTESIFAHQVQLYAVPLTKDPVGVTAAAVAPLQVV